MSSSSNGMASAISTGIVQIRVVRPRSSRQRITSRWNSATVRGSRRIERTAPSLTAMSRRCARKSKSI